MSVNLVVLEVRQIRTGNVDLGAALESTNALGARALAKKTAQDTRGNTLLDGRGVTDIVDLVTARELSLVTTLGAGLLDGPIGGGGFASADGSEEGEDGSSGSKLHFDGWIKDLG